MTLLIGAWTIGIILALLAIGIYVSFRICDFSDITTDGSFTLGAAVAAILLVLEVPPLPATAASFAAGALAGSVTGVLHARFKIHGLLAGILVMTALYSINLHVMGKSNLPLLSTPTLATYAESIGLWLSGGQPQLHLWGWEVATKEVAALGAVSTVVVGVAALLHWFLNTHLGTALRATGDNPQMIRALGVNVGTMLIMGLALSNGLVALSGALLAQYQGFADVQMGIGMIVLGLASVIIGEALVGTKHVGLAIVGAVMGALLFRLLVALALRWGLNPNDLKLITALFVFAALVLPGWATKIWGRRTAGALHA
jgi:putative tryptophan/tyrosine transport system permease protein